MSKNIWATQIDLDSRRKKGYKLGGKGSGSGAGKNLRGGVMKMIKFLNN